MIGNVFRSVRKRPSAVALEEHGHPLVAHAQAASGVMNLERDGITISFAAPNEVTAQRAKRLFTKEPDTIEWIRSFSEGDVLVDIGANVGSYSIWAALARDVQVYAFEPEAQNYAILNRNIALNKVHDKVVAYCMALGDVSRFALLYNNNPDAGGSGHTFGMEATYDLRPKRAAYCQGSYSVTLDGLVAEGVIPQPEHIKIDVDGLEHLVVKGALETIRSQTLRSILVEINLALTSHQATVGTLEDLGYRSTFREVARATDASGNVYPAGNFIFYRD